MTNQAAVVLVTTSFPVSADGSEAAGSFVSDLAAAMVKQLPVRVVAPGYSNSHETWNSGLEIFRFAAPDRPLSTLKPWSPTDLKSIRKVLTTGEMATRLAIQAGPTSHILALWALPSGHWARRISRQTGVPYSIWTLGSDIWTLGRIPLVRSYLRQVLRDAWICWSDGMILAEKTQAICHRKVEFLPSTRQIKQTRTTPAKESPPFRLLFLGRWHRNKGIDLLLDALELITEEDWQRIETVQICGGGPLAPLVESSVSRLRASGRPLELFGYLSKSEAESVISSADYLIIPSRIESIPVVFSDAMKLGTPVIATPVGDMNRLLKTYETGILAEQVSALAISKAIQNALSHSAYSFSVRTQEASLLFNLQRIVAKLTSSFHKSGI